MSRGWLVAIVGTIALFLTGCATKRVDEDELVWIRTPFAVRAGDDAAWSSAAFDDRGWQRVDSRLLPGTNVAGWSGIGWFRVWIDVPPAASGHPTPMHGRFVGAAEVFLDGERAFAVGDPDAVVAGGATPVDFLTEAPRWVTFRDAGRHLVAVRFASRDVSSMHRVGFPAGFELALAPRGTPPRAPGALLNPVFVGATSALALLHLLLFAFHRDRRENLHYALATASVACITIFDGGLRWATSTAQAIALFAAVGAAVVVSATALLRFYHAIFSRAVPRSYRLVVAGAAVAVATSWTTPRAFAYGVAAIAAIAQFWVLFSALARRASGAWIIGVGGVLCLLGTATQMLGEVGVIPRIGSVYVLGFLALLGSMSIYLAREIARDKGDLARKLIEVGELSARQRETMERYRTVFETTGTGTIMFGEDGLISLANEEWSQLTGHSREEIEGRMSWMTFFSDRSLEKMKTYHRLRSEDPSAAPRTYEAELRDRRGKLREGVVTINVVPGTKESVGSFLDLTDLKRAQRQMIRADKMSALGQIAAGVAHEINNPNNFIHFNLPILRRYVDAMRPLLEERAEQDPSLELLHMRYDVFIDDLFKLVDNMEHGSARITAIVSDLKSYIRSGEDLETKPGPIATVVDKAMVLAGKQVKKMVKRVDVEVADALPLVKMNAGKMEQVLINLLINAAQAADKDESWIKLDARASSAGDVVTIRVEDNGAGIPPESIEQIFEPFFTTKGRETGTGLGLSISQQIVEEHGGQLEVESVVGEGSTFTIRLPAAV